LNLPLCDTMSKATESAMSHENELCWALYDSSPDGILSADPQTRRFVRANRAMCEWLGYTNEELLSMSVSDIHPTESLPQVHQAFEALSNGHVACARNIPCRRKDSRVFYADITAGYDNSGPRPMVVGFFRDVTEHYHAIELLRKSESNWRRLFENLPDLVFTLDRNATVHMANRSTAQISKEAVVGLCGLSLVAPEHRPECRRALNRAFASGQPQNLHFQDVFGHWWLGRTVPLAKERDAEYAMLICTDVTQEHLATEAVNKEQRLLRRLLELQERERRLTAYEIHDGFAQQLAGALFRLQGLRDMHARDPARAWEDLESATRLIGRAIDETRRLISGLRPPILDESGVVHAIEYLVCESNEQGSPTIEFTHEVTFDRLAPPLESALFRIVQESVQNAIRHSRSDRIRIELTNRNDRIHLHVRDWGVGFNPDTVEEQRFGLQGIRERVRLLDGRVVIESSPGKGTHIAVDMPLVDVASDSPET
jgi:PAS domain S-box-containing protein